LQKKVGAKLLALPLIPLLLFSAVYGLVPQRAPGSTTNSIPLISQLDLPDGYFEYYQIDAAAVTNVLMIGSSSNVSVSTSVMNSAEFTAYNNTESGIVNSLFISNGTSAFKTLDVPKGDYFLVFLAYSDNANISFNWLLYPNSPYQTGPLPSPEPSGIGAFGLNNNSGVVTPYSVESNEVVGVADITSLLAHNSTASLADSEVSGSTLQLNTVLVVNEQNGTQQVYWVQDTPDFVTSAMQVANVDNVWNYSISGFLGNTTITSSMGGFAYSYQQYNATQYFYANGTGNSTYALPFDIALMVNETIDPGVGVVVQTGTQILRNGTALESPADWFDNVTIHDPTVTSAYYLVSGNSSTPEATYFDSELVFVGEANGESTSFTQMSASLQLFYDSNSTGLLTYYPSYYSFGQDTAEASDNLRVSYNGNGVATLSAGTPNYVYLGSASGSTSLSQLEAAATSTSSASQTTTSSSSSSSGLSSIPASYLLVVAAAAATILVAGIGRRSRAGAGFPSGRDPVD
jgi:thermopsin